MMRVLGSSAPNTIQDFGREGNLSLGVGATGAMDRLALAAGNLLVGNSPDAAGVEIAMAPLRLRFGCETVFSITGAHFFPTLDGMALPAWSATRAAAGQRLELLQPPLAGARAYFCVEGGINAPLVLGSRSTDVKGGFGGLHGRGLVKGDRLYSFAGMSRSPIGLGQSIKITPPLYGDGQELSEIGPSTCQTIRFLPAAEFDWLDAASLETLQSAHWTVTPQSNRMGMRLAGPRLQLNDKRRELLSHGIVPGVIQLPPAGQPIVQMVDGNTAGGYPKIGVIVRADMRLMAQIPLGARIRFLPVCRAQAKAALERERQCYARHCHAICDRLRRR